MSQPIQRPGGPAHATQSTNLADILDRVLDKGIVIAGDIKIRLVDIELLTLQIRLVVCSVDRAVEMGIDWWRRDPHLLGAGEPPRELTAGDRQELEGLRRQVELLERRLAERDG